ncbi:hypothetical protein Tco_1255161 [Tanacetum coccineum]
MTSSMQARNIRLDTPQGSKLDLENKVRQEQALGFSIVYLEEYCLKNANKVARDMFAKDLTCNTNYPMLSKKPKAATADLHKDLLAQVTGKTSSEPSTSETPKVLAPGMYNLGVKPTFRANKPVPKRDPRNRSSLPAKRVHARRVKAHHRTLNKKNRVDSHLLVKHSSRNVNPTRLSVLNANPRKNGNPLRMLGNPLRESGNQLANLLLIASLSGSPLEGISHYLRSSTNCSMVSGSGCSKHMTGDRARLINFVEKFIGTVRFGNDEILAPSLARIRSCIPDSTVLIHSQLDMVDLLERTELQPDTPLTE